MKMSSFARRWLYDPDKPKFRDYPSKLNDDEDLPELDDSLDDIGEYQRRLWANKRRSLLLVIHGPDTSGKDSLIRTLATYADPAGFHAWSFSRPDGLEASHHFLWRVGRKLPARGEMVAFNRSHHEAVIAERVWLVLDPDDYNWNSRFRSIRDFEQHLVAEGTQIIKIWLNLSEEEHSRRLLKRLDKPRKRWKFERSDIDGWEKRKLYEEYAEEALHETHIDEAPWFIVPGDEKPQARAIVAQIVADQLKRMAPEYPKEDPEILEEYRRLLEDKGVK
ncbi:polyphosphate kinase [Marinobacter salinisoli]|uniref:Polyphosphate kinase n=1 Tax=Marinobacter salinisoli TaxID=2769486 RepID=A0ABX7MV43_9GAMM|nr:polyphosphate kinase [Marinobacter salinisoli]QSP95330.1 polyphosphate kinase [Marinobacter salinisoli]